MNNLDLAKKVHKVMDEQCATRGFAAPADVLIDLGYLTKQDYNAWRNGKVPYLERVCKTNLSKLTLINKEIRAYARQHGLKPSMTIYKSWGKGSKKTLQFSKSDRPEIEKSYATHYVVQKSSQRISQEK